MSYYLLHKLNHWVHTQLIPNLAQTALTESPKYIGKFLSESAARDAEKARIRQEEAENARRDAYNRKIDEAYRLGYDPDYDWLKTEQDR